MYHSSNCYVRWLDKIRTVDRPYQFIKFGVFNPTMKRILPHSKLCTADRYIERLRREYADPSNQQVRAFPSCLPSLTHTHTPPPPPPPPPLQNTKRLKEELAGVQTIMRKNIDDIISRGAALEGMCTRPPPPPPPPAHLTHYSWPDLSKSSSKLVQDSRRYYSETKKLNLMVKYKKYIPFAVLGLFLLFLIWYKFF